MQFGTFLIPAFLAAAVVAAPVTDAEIPSATIDKRAVTFCGQWDSVVTGTYTVYNNKWGQSAATSGSQCTTVTSDVSNSLVWSTSWSWAGGSTSVKSYANAVVTQSTGIKLSAIKTIPSTWKYR
jgi:xyloglucan-specific endo-beta-1,4-glucanase